jgi:hypothetical protein
MSRVIQTTVYKFDELSDKAKERARDWYREGAFDFDWWDGIYEDAATIANLMGINIRQQPVKLMNGRTRYDPAISFEGFSIQGSGASFEGQWIAENVEMGKVQDHAPTDKELHRIAAEFEAVARLDPEASFTVKQSGRGSHEGCTEFEINLPNVDEADEDATRDRLKEAARDLMRWIFKQLEAEWDYQNSDEQIDETIRANEYEFTEEGEPS